MPHTEISDILGAHIQAVNAHDTDAIIATFAPDAFVNDASRAFIGTAAIRRWVEREIVGDNVTYEVVEAFEHHGDTIIRLQTDG